MRHTTSAGTAARRSCPSTRPDRRRPARSARCAARTTPGPTGSTAALLKAPHTELSDFDDRDVRAAPGRVGAWGGFCFVHLSPATAQPLRDGSRALVAPSRATPWRPRRRRRFDVRRRRQLQGLAENYNECYHCGPVHPELTRLVPSFGGGGTDLDWEAGVEHREGAWTFTMTGTTNRTPFPGLDEAERDPAQGRAAAPEPLAVLLGRPRRGLHAVAASVDRTRVDCDAAVRSRRGGGADDFSPADAGDLWDLVNRQDWAVCESVQRGMTSRAYSHGWFAPMEDDAPTSVAGCCRGWGGADDVSTFDYVVVGLGALGSAATYAAGQGGHSRASGSSSSSSATSAAPARHQPDPAAQLPHAGVRRPHLRGYDDWARLEDDSGQQLVTRSAGSTCSRRTRRSRWTTTRVSLDRVGIDFELLDVHEIAARWPQFALPDGTVGLYQERGSIVPAGPRHARSMQSLAASAARCCATARR